MEQIIKTLLLGVFLLFITGCRFNKQGVDVTDTEVTKDGYFVVEPDEIAENDGSFFEEEAMIQEIPSAQYQRLMEVFRQNNVSGGQGSYPAFYGGAYINPNGNLVVNIAGDFQKGKREAVNIIGEEGIIYQPVTYSLQELTDIMDSLNTFAVNNSNHPVVIRMSSWSTDEKDNRVKVSLIQLDDNIRKTFQKEILDSPAILLERVGRIERVSNGGGDLNCNQCGLYLSVAQKSYPLSSKEVGIIVKNERKSGVSLGNKFVEVFNGKGWDRIIIEGYAEPDILYTIPQGGTWEYSIALHPQLYNYVAGRYRIFIVLHDDTQGENYSLAAEFRLE